MHEVYITSLGTYLPGQPVPNSEIETYLGRVHGKPSRHRALVLRQNKIATRHYALTPDGEPTTSSEGMAAQAIRQAVAQSELALEDISYLASASTLGDLLAPGLASHVHAALQIPPIEIANFQSVCGSSLMAIKSAWLQLRTGEHRCAAVSASEFASRYFRPGYYESIEYIHPDDSVPLEADFLRFTLSDGAGAALLECTPNRRQPSLKIRWIDIRSFADRFPTCMMAGGARGPDTIQPWGNFSSPQAAMEAGALILTQDFELMKKMIPVWIAHYLELIDQGRIHTESIDVFCSHYSSHSLREEAIRLLKQTGGLIDPAKWFSNIATKGNTGSASIFIMLEELYRMGNLQSGQTILCHVPESGRCINGFMLLEVV